MINAGIIGFGYWGPIIARNINSVEGLNLKAICDSRLESREKAQKSFTGINVCSQADDILEDPGIDLVIIVTPVHTHYELAVKALQNGKHIFVEKPFTTTSEQGEKLVELAEKKNLTIMVDHTFLFTGAVKKIKEIVDSKALGNLLYYDSVRINLGLFQHDVNVIWDLAPHDLSIMDYLIGKNPEAVCAHGACHYNNKLEDVAYLVLHFEDNLIAHFHLNWLSPTKIRHTLLGGEKQMLFWDDMDPENKIRIYDKGVDVKTSESIYEMLYSYRWGDMWAPRIPNSEALNVEFNYLKECLETGKKPHNDGLAGLRVVKLLELSDRSLKDGGKLIEL
jgi:predicted dehydrogenase